MAINNTTNNSNNNPTYFTEISFSNVQKQVQNYLLNLYNKSNILFDVSSPYGQLLSVIENQYTLSLLYLKRSIDQFDLSTTAANNKRLVNTGAIIAGHIPGRPISATGTLRIKIKPTTDLTTDIPGNLVTIANRTQIKNSTNGLNYAIDLGGADNVSYKVQAGLQFYLSIVQGLWQISTFTGTGEKLQSFSVNIPGGNTDVENFNVIISVNGQIWPLRKNLYDMSANEQVCIVRTGFNGGVDIIFGNGDFGAIPIIGSIIDVNYILSDGSRGSIFRRTINDWKIIGDVLDGFGNTLDITQYFDIYISTDINFGADSESIDFTRSLLPIVSTNFVLALPEQYAYYIKRLGVFSHVNAYEQYGRIIIVCTPNIQLFRNTNQDYFSIDLAAFTLDAYEISKIDTYLKTSGTIQLSKRYTITSPNLAKYTINVFVVLFSDAIMENVKNEINNAISNYFLNFNRMDRVPKKDIISILSNFNDIDSVDISFVSKANEDYYASYIKTDSNIRNTKLASLSHIFKPNTSPTYNPNTSIGLDPIQGDILFTPDQIPVIRGGWYDRNGIHYSDTVNSSGLGSVNIIQTGTTPRKDMNNS